MVRRCVGRFLASCPEEVLDSPSAMVAQALLVGSLARLRPRQRVEQQFAFLAQALVADWTVRQTVARLAHQLVVHPALVDEAAHWLEVLEELARQAQPVLQLESVRSRSALLQAAYSGPSVLRVLAQALRPSPAQPAPVSMEEAPQVSRQAPQPQTARRVPCSAPLAPASRQHLEQRQQALVEQPDAFSRL
ncbi:MAG: hypothetical protein WBD19_08580 [Candidatus Acidiferrum sp.]